MKFIQIRPRFELTFPGVPAGLQPRLRSHLNQAEVRVDASIFDHHAVMRIPQEDQHYWSPQLHLTWEQTAQAPTILHGRYSPHPSVWTLFAFFYGASIFVGIMGLIFGLAQLQLDKTPSGMWALGLSIALVTLAYLVAYIGQKLGEAEMDQLRAELDQALEQASVQNLNEG